MEQRKIGFTETILRDAGQSLIATRLAFSEMEPILGKLDQAGYYSLECWGGATFDVCLRFLNEDPWERLRKIPAAVPNTQLQMLLRGQNILGYKHYSDDVVRRFVKASVRNGIDIIRIFDRLRRHLLHHEPRAHARSVREARQGDARDGRFDHLHQGHGRHHDAR